MAEITYALNLNWETEHDTAKGLMIHTLSDRVKVVSDIKNGTVKVFKNGALTNFFNAKGWRVSDYTQFLAGIATNEAILQLEPAN